MQGSWDMSPGGRSQGNDTRFGKGFGKGKDKINKKGKKSSWFTIGKKGEKMQI